MLVLYEKWILVIKKKAKTLDHVSSIHSKPCMCLKQLFSDKIMISEKRTTTLEVI